MKTTNNEELKKIIHIDTELNKIQDLDILLEQILLEARNAVKADAGTIYVKEGNLLSFRYAQNDTLQKNLPKGQKLIYSIFKIEINPSTIAGYVAHTGEILNISDMYEIPKDAPYSFNPKYDRMSGYRTGSTLTIPLQTNTRDIVGVLQLINKMDKKGNVIPFTDFDELFALHFASTATIAYQRARLTRAILLRMISMAELRDPKETGAHVNRVAAYTVEMYEYYAKQNGISEHEVESIRDILRMAAMIHDVGKVAISDAILKKPARLTEEEYEIMKTHTTQGARLFNEKHSYLDEMASQIALRHHENWDGTGYPGYIDIETGEPLKTDDKGAPLGLKGEEIPLYGRIVAIADVFDALISKRTYKEAWKEEDVLNEMHKLSGKKFDPYLIDIFFAVLPNLKQVVERYPDSE